eukprot:TRINITY_DN90374_c0_g1_i1.p3 TRINITY_DN90374_c0_g1~~TRINITY_DN90374_c0_g1_i1.p3  ORF type:complete len:107 (+),score=17.57 TRINITY_DN90374_c0_g1_i1:839-1159(+)
MRGPLNAGSPLLEAGDRPDGKRSLEVMLWFGGACEELDLMRAAVDHAERRRDSLSGRTDVLRRQASLRVENERRRARPPKTMLHCKSDVTNQITTPPWEWLASSQS